MTGSGNTLFVMQPVDIFGPLYLATLLLGLAFMVITGIRKNYPAATWAGIVATIMVLFVTGLKLFSYSPGEIGQILSGRFTEIKYVKFVPGGILLVALGFWIAKRWLRFHRFVFDDFIFILPALQLVQRSGCFLSGCCSGTPTSIPWAVHYAEPSTLYYQHYELGLLEAGSLHSLGVHPTQLYTMLISGVILAVLLATRRRFKRPGSFTMFALLLLGGMRFFLEFFRQPLVGSWQALEWQSINVLQWMILSVAMVISTILWWRERKNNVVRFSPKPITDQPYHSSALILLLIILVWQVRVIFDSMEFILLSLVLLGGLAISSTQIVLRVTTPVSRMAMGSLLVAAFFTMGQNMDDALTDKDDSYGWFSLGLGGGVGAYEHINRDCSGNITSRTRRDYTQGGISAAYHYKFPKNRTLEAGMRHYYLYNPDPRNPDKETTFYFFNPYMGYDAVNYATTLGLSYGRGLKEEEYSSIFFWPVLYLRFGNRNRYFIDAETFNRTHFLGPASVAQLGMGYGFNSNGRNLLRFGMALDMGDRAGVYVGGDFLLQDRYTISPYFTLVKYPSIGINMRFNFGEHRVQPANRP